MNSTIHGNATTTSMEGNSSCGSVNDIGLDKGVRLAILYLTIVFGVVGSLFVLLWMFCNRRTRFSNLSRVNTFILNLTMADVSVILLAVLPQLVWEYVDRAWTAGPIMCRLVKFLQSFSMMASNYILVAIAIDRHQAIRAPLKESWAVWKMAGIGWGMAALCSLPMLGVFRLNVRDGVIMCENIFRELPELNRQLWIAYICFIVFFIPLLILTICYTRIFLKIAHKAKQNDQSKTVSYKTGKFQLQSTRSASLPRAKIKTLKLTFAIIIVFVVCSLPYFVVEMIMSFGDHCSISKVLYGLLGGMAACNSAANPFVFLLFNMNIDWLKQLRDRTFAQKKAPRYMYSPTSSTESHYNNGPNSRGGTHTTVAS